MFQLGAIVASILLVPPVPMLHYPSVTRSSSSSPSSPSSFISSSIIMIIKASSSEFSPFQFWWWSHSPGWSWSATRTGQEWWSRSVPTSSSLLFALTMQSLPGQFPNDYQHHHCHQFTIHHHHQHYHHHHHPYGLHLLTMHLCTHALCSQNQVRSFKFWNTTFQTFESAAKKRRRVKLVKFCALTNSIGSVHCTLHWLTVTAVYRAPWKVWSKLLNSQKRVHCIARHIACLNFTAVLFD